MEAKIDVLINNVNDLKISNNKIITSFNLLTEKVTTITHRSNEHSTKINNLALQYEVLNSKLNSVEADIEATKLIVPITAEELIFESIDRQTRMFNVLLYNLPETQNDEANASSDSTTVEDIHDFLGLRAKPIAVTRVGKFNANATRYRPLRLRYSSPEDTFEVFKCNKKLRMNSAFKELRISSDRTRQQQVYMGYLRQELHGRRSNGEQGLIIKYVRGVPLIVSKRN